MSDTTELRKIAEAATPGPWHWAGNTDNGEPYLATWIPGAGRCQVLSIGSEDRSPKSRAADELRSYAEESGEDPDDLIHDWMHDSFGEVIRDPRLQFMTDLMCVNARESVVYEVAPNAVSRDDPKVYRADIVGIRHPDATFIAAASPKVVLGLLTEVDRLTQQIAAVRALHTPEKRYVPYVEFEGSFDTAEAAAEYADSEDPESAMAEVTFFTVCAECARVESTQLQEQGDDWSYRESLWPCKIAEALPSPVTPESETNR